MMPLCVQVLFCRHTLSFLLGKYLGVELLGQMVSVCLTLSETAKTHHVLPKNSIFLAKVAIPSRIPSLFPLDFVD